MLATHPPGAQRLALRLAYLPEAELQTLAATLPEADAVIGGPTGQTLRPQRLGGAGALLTSATRKGKFMVEAAFGPGTAVLRFMPNVAAEVRRGTFCYAAGGALELDRCRERGVRYRTRKEPRL